MELPICIVGAGLSGLALGHALARRGLPFRVLEAADRAGGVIRSERLAGEVIDWGPQRIRLTPGLAALMRGLGIEDRLIRAPAGLPLHIFRDGRLRPVPFSFRELAKTDLLSRSAKLRLLLEPLTRAARPDETVGGYLRRRFGSEAARHLLGPLFGGLYGTDPDEMYVRHALAPLLRQLGVEGSTILRLIRFDVRGSAEASAACSFGAGLQTFTDALHAGIAEHVYLGERVVSLARDGARFRVATSRGVHDAAHVVLTAPADQAAALLAPIDPALGGRLARLRYNTLALVALRAYQPLHGFGYQMSLDEPFATRGVTFTGSLFGRDGVCMAFLGGGRDPSLAAKRDAEIGELAAHELRTVTGSAADVIGVRRVRMPAWDRSWTALDGLVLPAGIDLCANYESRAGIPGRLRRAESLARRLHEERDASGAGALRP